MLPNARRSGTFQAENRVARMSAFLVNSETFATVLGVTDESSASLSFGQIILGRKSKPRRQNRHLACQVIESREGNLFQVPHPLAAPPSNTIKINDWLR